MTGGGIVEPEPLGFCGSPLVRLSSPMTQRVAARYSCHHTCFQLQDVETYDPRNDGDCFTPHAQV